MKISRLKFKKIYNKTLEDITRRESLLANEQKKHGEVPMELFRLPPRGKGLSSRA